MTIYQATLVSGQQPTPQPNGSEVVAARGELVLAAGTALVVGDVLEFVELPGACVPDDWEVDSDALDSSGTPALAFDAGIINSGETAVSAAAADGGAKWATAGTFGQAAALTRASSIYHKRVTSEEDTPRKVGLVVTHVAATWAGGTIGFTLKYRASYQGE